MRFTIATPAFTPESCHPKYMASLETAVKFFNARYLPLYGCPDVAHARNQLLHKFRYANYDDVLVWIDADIEFSLTDLGLLLAPLEYGKGEICAGLYLKKKPGRRDLVGQFYQADVDEEKGYVGETMTLEDEKYIRLEFCGGGFWAMTRGAIEQACSLREQFCPDAGLSVTQGLKERAAWLFHSEIYLEPVQNLPRHRGEDYTACATFNEAGFTIWSPLGLSLTHHSKTEGFGGREPIDINYFARSAAFGYSVMADVAAGKTPIDFQKRLARVT